MAKHMLPVLTNPRGRIFILLLVVFMLGDGEVSSERSSDLCDEGRVAEGASVAETE